MVRAERGKRSTAFGWTRPHVTSPIADNLSSPPRHYHDPIAPTRAWKRDWAQYDRDPDVLALDYLTRPIRLLWSLLNGTRKLEEVVALRRGAKDDADAELARARMLRSQDIIAKRTGGVQSRKPVVYVKSQSRAPRVELEKAAAAPTERAARSGGGDASAAGGGTAVGRSSAAPKGTQGHVATHDAAPAVVFGGSGLPHRYRRSSTAAASPTAATKVERRNSVTAAPSSSPTAGSSPLARSTTGLTSAEALKARPSFKHDDGRGAAPSGAAKEEAGAIPHATGRAAKRRLGTPASAVRHANGTPAKPSAVVRPPAHTHHAAHQAKAGDREACLWAADVEAARSVAYTLKNVRALVALRVVRVLPASAVVAHNLSLLRVICAAIR